MSKKKQAKAGGDKKAATVKSLKGNARGIELPLATLPSAHPCNECGQCCTYIAVEIDNPSDFEDYDNMFWYLAHKGVSVYIDFDSDWFIEFETVCEHLSPSKTCGIYEERPHMCSSFSWDECEKNTQERAWKVRFTKPDELFAYIEKKRPRNFERYIRDRDKMRRKREKAAAQTPSESPEPTLSASVSP